MSSTEKRIGLVAWDYFSPKGGMGLSLQWIVNTLLVAGYWLPVKSPKKKLFGGHVIFSLQLLFTLRRWIKSNSINSLMLPVGPGGVFLMRKPKIPVTSIVYHTYLQQSRLVPGQSWKKIFIPFERRTLKMSEKILCFAADTKRVLINDYRISEDRIHLLPHAIDIDAWNYSGEKDNRLCVCVARLEKRKGVDVLMCAWPEVLRKIPDAKLVIVGRGVMAKQVDAQMKKIGSSITRHDSMDQKDLQSLVGRSAIALCPAYLEGFGLAAAEAMAAGTPVIASNVDGLRNLVDEHSGALVPAGDAQVLADAIVELLKDDQQRKNKGVYAKAMIKRKCDPSIGAHQLVQTMSL